MTNHDYLRSQVEALYKIRLVGIDALETSKKKRQTAQPYSQKSKVYVYTRFIHTSAWSKILYVAQHILP